MHVVMSSYATLGQAETAVAALNKAGFANENIGVLLRGALADSKTIREKLQAKEADKALSGAGIGAAVGTAVGGLFGLLAGAAPLAVPVIGPILAGGVLATTLGGAATGAVYGTLLGLVIKLGLSGEDARFFTETLANDGAIVVVEARGEQAARAWRIMHETKATKTQSAIVGRSQNTATNMPVVGLFPNTQDAHQAKERLVDKGIDQEEIYLVDDLNFRAKATPPTTYLPSPVGLNPMPVLPLKEAGPNEQVAESHLTRLGIDAADAPFYLDAVRQGGALLIVTTDDKREAATSRRVMKSLDVTQMAAPAMP